MAKKSINKIKKNTPVNKSAKGKTYIKVVTAILVVVLAAFLIFSEFFKKNEKDTDYVFRQDGVLTFTDSANAVKTKADIQIADNEYDEELGLMNRKQMDENRGMLFIFPESRIQTFWMRNTFIPLDMIFVDSAKTIVTIQKNTKILSDQTYSSNVPAQYVIEVNAGYCNRHNIKTGDNVSWVRTQSDAN